MGVLPAGGKSVANPTVSASSNPSPSVRGKEHRPDMKSNRFWIEIIAVGTSMACAVALLIAILGAAGAGLSDTQALGQTSQAARTQPASTVNVGPSQVFEGMITCSRCLAKHSAKIGSNAADCTRKCVHAGASFALVDGDNTYMLEGNLSALKGFAGERVRINGVRQGNKIQVLSVVAA